MIKNIFVLFQDLRVIFILIRIIFCVGHSESSAGEWETFEIAVVQPGCGYLSTDDAAVLAGARARLTLIDKVASHWRDLLSKQEKYAPFEFFAALAEGLLKIEVTIINTEFPRKAPTIIAQARTAFIGNALEAAGDQLMNHPSLMDWFEDYRRHEKGVLDTIISFEKKLGCGAASSVQPLKVTRGHLRQEFHRLVDKLKAGEFYRNALAEWPRDDKDENMYYLADLAIVTGNLGRAIELDSECAGCYYLRGEIYRIAQYFDFALKDYNEAIRLSPNFAGAYESRAIVYDRLAAHDAQIACRLGKCEAKILFEVFGAGRKDAGKGENNE